MSGKYLVTAVLATGYGIEVNADSKEDAESIVENNLLSNPDSYSDSYVDSWITINVDEPTED
jgi:hypothetical protein